MKALLEINLPEEEQELMMIVNAGNFLQIIYEFREWLRALNKHGHPYRDADEAVDMIYQEFCQRTARLEEFD